MSLPCDLCGHHRHHSRHCCTRVFFRRYHLRAWTLVTFLDIRTRTYTVLCFSLSSFYSSSSSSSHLTHHTVYSIVFYACVVVIWSTWLFALMAESATTAGGGGAGGMQPQHSVYYCVCVCFVLLLCVAFVVCTVMVVVVISRDTHTHTHYIPTIASPIVRVHWEQEVLLLLLITPFYLGP